MCIRDRIRSLERNHEHDSLASSSSLARVRRSSANDTFDGHHHILQLFDFFETQDSIVLITQLCQKDDLYELIINNGKLDLQRQVIPFTACLISAFQFLHSHGIVHRDIKAENVLFRLNKNKSQSNNTVDTKYDLMAHDLILADFGLAVQLDAATDNVLKEDVGTISYIAPEIVKCKGVGSFTRDELTNLKKYGCPVDIWALGVLVYFMAFGYTPFDCETDDETLDCISKCDYYMDEELVNDPKYKEFWSFIKCCFIVDDNRRPSSFDLKTHPFISDYFTTSNGSSRPQYLLRSQSHTLADYKEKQKMKKNSNTSKDIIVEDQELVDVPEDIYDNISLVRNKSSSSLHSLKSPSRSNISSNSSSTSLSYFSISRPKTKNTNVSDDSVRPQNESTHKLNVPELLLQKEEDQQTHDKNLDKIRDTLRRTLSMTSLRKPVPLSLSLIHI